MITGRTSCLAVKKKLLLTMISHDKRNNNGAHFDILVLPWVEVAVVI